MESVSSTRKLIEKSNLAVKNGMESSAKTAGALKTIIDTTEEVADIVDNISEISKQQAESVKEIAKSIGEISIIVEVMQEVLRRAPQLQKNLYIIQKNK